MTTQQKKLVDGTKISLYDQEVWDRNTVADGVWLQSETLEPISANDRILASAINYVSEGVDRLTGRIDSLCHRRKGIYDNQSIILAIWFD